MALTKGELTPAQMRAEEMKLVKSFLRHKDEGNRDLQNRINGISNTRGGTGKQFAGYTSLLQFYRGDQWDHDEPAGASQRTDNYCAVIIDNLSSLIFDDNPEINCPTDDPTDDLLELLAEAKERLVHRVWVENDSEVEFDELAKVAGATGDGFIKGPWAEKVTKRGKTFWQIRFSHIEDPGTVIPIWKDQTRRELLGFIHYNEMAFSVATEKWGERAVARGINLEANIVKSPLGNDSSTSDVPTVKVAEFWTENQVSYFVADKLLDWYNHNWGFVPLEHIKNIHSPGHPYGKSDIEDILDPQLMHNRTNNDLANFLKWISSVNLWGKNIEGMQALVAGLSRIYSVPEDGELHAFEKPGDPYITNTWVQQRRGAIVELSGISENLLSGSQLGNASGRALAVAFQGTIRKLAPKTRRYRLALQHLNSNILRLFEIYYPETKNVIRGDYRNEVFLPQTLLRNIVDTINKLQSGLISQTTAMREVGVQQPKREQKLIVKDLSDPVLGPQIARQPALLPRLSEGQNQPGDNPNPAPGNSPGASQRGAVNSNNQSASGAAPTPTE